MILVTGCSGLVGTHLCQKLEEDGYSVVGVDIKFSPALPATEQFQFHNIDLTEWVKTCINSGAGELMITSIRYDGKVGGPDFQLLEKIANFTSVPVLYSGGINSVDSVEKVMSFDNISGACISSALYKKIINLDFAEFEVVCGKGTYVRSLARDIAEKLNTRGHITNLRRQFVGNFHEKDTIFIDFFDEILHSPSILKKIKPIEKVLDDIPALFLTETEAIKIRQGQKNTLDSFKFHNNLIKEHPNYKKFERIYTISDDKIIALIEIDEGIVKPKRIINY